MCAATPGSIHRPISPGGSNPPRIPNNDVRTVPRRYRPSGTCLGKTFTGSWKPSRPLPGSPPEGMRSNELSDGRQGVDVLFRRAIVERHDFPHPPARVSGRRRSHSAALLSDPVEEGKGGTLRRGVWSFSNHALIAAFRIRVVRCRTGAAARNRQHVRKKPNRIAAGYYEDPGCSEVAFARNALEAQEADIRRRVSAVGSRRRPG